jgi:predicted metalloprotease with PDZ domain
MYEGVTEYFAQHFQVHEGLVLEDEFYKAMSSKINISKRFNDRLSFTKLSENIIDEPYAKEFYNVYCKGALIGMSLDILIQVESEGKRSLVSVMKELSEKYGKDKPFDDDAILVEIAEMTYPSIGEFLKNHVEGNTPIPYHEIFDEIGLKLSKYNIISVDENANDAKVALRNKWLNTKSNLD